MTSIASAATIIVDGIQAHVHAAGPIPTDPSSHATSRITGLAVAIMGDLLEAGWILPNVEPTPDIDRPGLHQSRPSTAPAFCRDLDYLAELQYRMGVTAREWATETIAFHIAMWATVRVRRAHDPLAFPYWWPDLSIEAMATRLVGTLLGGGWTSPVDIFATSPGDGAL